MDNEREKKDWREPQVVEVRIEDTEHHAGIGDDGSGTTSGS
jgi:hypothetical protein